MHHRGWGRIAAQDAGNEMPVGMSRKGGPKPAHQIGISRPDLGPFAEPFAVGQAMEGKPAAAFAKDVALGPHAGLKIVPPGGLPDIGGDARPDGRKKPFLGPSGPRHGAGIGGQRFPQSVAQFRVQAAPLRCRRFGEGGEQGLGQVKDQAAGCTHARSLGQIG
jgi:hypothetical protein